MKNEPNEDRAAIIGRLAERLDKSLLKHVQEVADVVTPNGVVDVEQFDLEGDSLIVRVYPDATRQDKPNRFRIKVSHLAS